MHKPNPFHAAEILLAGNNFYTISYFLQLNFYHKLNLN